MITSHSIRDFSLRQIADLASSELHQLKNEIDERYRAAKAAKDWIDMAIDFKFAERARALRQHLGKDTGVVRFDDQGIAITVDAPKRVVWDQALLADIVKRIAASGEDPAEYVDISYKVPEKKYSAWPESLRESFSAARTLKTGKPAYTIGEGDA